MTGDPLAVLHAAIDVALDPVTAAHIDGNNLDRAAALAVLIPTRDIEPLRVELVGSAGGAVSREDAVRHALERREAG